MPPPGCALSARATTAAEGSPYPTQNVIEEFAEVGGKMILFGSDAHCVNDVASPFDKIENMDLCGLTPGVFIKRKFVAVN